MAAAEAPPIPRSPFGIGFLTPTTPETPLSSSHPSLDPSTLSDLSHEDVEQGSGEWDEASPSPDESSAGTRSKGSSPESEAAKVELLTEEELQTICRAGVAGVGEKAHDLLAVTDGQRAVDLWKTDEGDQANIGDPLASIAARRQGVVGKVNPDVKDLLSAMVGVVGYFTKQINLRSQARGYDAGAAAGQQLPEAVDL